MVACASAQLAEAILQADARHIRRIVAAVWCIGVRYLRIVRIILQVIAAALQRDFEILARRDARTGDLIIEEQVVVDLHRQFAEFDVRQAILAVRIDAFQ